MKQDKKIGEAIFSASLRRRMDELEWTQERVADAAKVSQASVNAWLGGSIPRADSLYELAQEMRVSMELLLTGKNSGGSAPPPFDAEKVRREERQRLAIRLRKLLVELEA